MTKMDDIEKRLETRINHVLTAFWTITVFLFAIMASGASYIVSMYGDIKAIKQYEKDHGGEIVRNIEKPVNKEQLAANLSLASAQIQIARAENRKPDSKKLAALQSALRVASKDYPDLPEVWQADAQLVSYKSIYSGVERNELPLCDTEKTQLGQKKIDIPGSHMIQVGYFFSNCILDLEKLPVRTGIIGPIRLDGGVVVYDGGPIADGNVLFAFSNCKFSVTIHSVPDKPIRDLLLAVLEEKGNFISNLPA